MTKVKINGEFEIVLTDHRASRPEWYTEEGWEKARLKSMHEHLKQGDIMYYVGAEEGEMPALCQMWGAEVFLFEPNPKAWPNIKATWEANNLKPPMSYFVGFASDHNSDEKSWFNAIGNNAFPECANDEIVADHGFLNLSTESEMAPHMMLDSLQIGFDAICVDVEGAEGKVLRGAEHIIRKYKPRLWISIHPEFLITQYNEWSFELRKWIKDLGYKETILDYQHELHVFYDPL